MTWVVMDRVSCRGTHRQTLQRSGRNIPTARGVRVLVDVTSADCPFLKDDHLEYFGMAVRLEAILEI